jgi:hypothetical protein
MVGLLWINDHVVAVAATYTTHNKTKRQTTMPSVVFEPSIPAIESPQNHALAHAATGVSPYDHRPPTCMLLTSQLKGFRQEAKSSNWPYFTVNTKWGKLTPRLQCLAACIIWQHRKILRAPRWSCKTKLVRVVIFTSDFRRITRQRVTWTVKLKVKFTLDQAMNAQSGSEGVTLLFNVGTRWGRWSVLLLYPQQRPGIHCIGGWVDPLAGMDTRGKFRRHRDSIHRPSSPAFLKLWSADHKWSSGSALEVLLDWTSVQKWQKK